MRCQTSWRPIYPCHHNILPSLSSLDLQPSFYCLTDSLSLEFNRDTPLPRLPMITRNGLLLVFWFLLDKGFLAPLHAPPQSRMGREQHLRGVEGLGLRRHVASGVQRVKRGWVWNQFFVLEEYMGSEPQYVGKVRPPSF